MAYMDRLGRPCEIVPGFAARVFSGGASGVNSGYRQSAGTPAALSERAGHLLAVRSRAGLGLRLLDALTPASSGPDALVIGASTGAECVWIADSLPSTTNASVIGTNLTDETVLSDSGVDALAAALGDAGHADRLAGRVSLRRDDIAHSALPSSGFDRVYSWQTFEHVMDLPGAFRHLARVLRPGGAAFIEYNPFFSLDGAHWPATIDIPWAHARMEPRAFADAVETLHPAPRPDAASFVSRAINRATQRDMLNLAEAAGLEVVSHLPRIRTEDALLLDHGIIEAVADGFPDATPCDLTARIVRLVLRRPGSGR
jgi:SAM-dependent methyltransferase